MKQDKLLKTQEIERRQRLAIHSGLWLPWRRPRERPLRGHGQMCSNNLIMRQIMMSQTRRAKITEMANYGWHYTEACVCLQISISYFLPNNWRNRTYCLSFCQTRFWVSQWLSIPVNTFFNKIFIKRKQCCNKGAFWWGCMFRAAVEIRVSLEPTGSNSSSVLEKH